MFAGISIAFKMKMLPLKPVCRSFNAEENYISLIPQSSHGMVH